jgi:hypothetical protein
MKLFVAVVHVEEDPWRTIVNSGQIPIWRNQNLMGTSIVYFKGKSKFYSRLLNRIVEDMRWSKGPWASYFISYLLSFSLYLKRTQVPQCRFHSMKEEFPMYEISLSETTFNMRWKRLALIRHFLEETDDDILIMINSSSSLNLKRLRDDLKNVHALHSKSSPFAGGAPIYDSHDGKFISGAFIVLNRIAASMLFANSSLIPVHVMDDIGIGTTLTKLGVPFSPLSSITMEAFFDQPSIDSKLLEHFCHYRFKGFQNGIRSDVYLMQKFREILQTWNI